MIRSILFVLGFAAFAMPTFGDDVCKTGQSAVERLHSSDLVFRGIVRSTFYYSTVPTDFGGVEDDREAYRHAIEVTHRYKGIPGPSARNAAYAIVYTRTGGGERVRFGEGEQLIFADRTLGRYFTFECFGNRDLSEGADSASVGWQDVEAIEDDVSDAGKGCGFGSLLGAIQSVTFLALGAAVMRRRTYRRSPHSDEPVS